MGRRDKIKDEHHMLKEFFPLLREIEKHPAIHRIIPGVISRKQKKSSIMRFRVSYYTQSGLKCIMSKWSTAQELFVICDQQDAVQVQDFLEKTGEKFILN
jgi:hypothetical protein